VPCPRHRSRARWRVVLKSGPAPLRGVHSWGGGSLHALPEKSSVSPSLRWGHIHLVRTTGGWTNCAVSSLGRRGIPSGLLLEKRLNTTSTTSQGTTVPPRPATPLPRPATPLQPIGAARGAKTSCASVEESPPGAAVAGVVVLLHSPPHILGTYGSGEPSFTGADAPQAHGADTPVPGVSPPYVPVAGPDSPDAAPETLPSR
jgi:hypothetical protein